MKASDIDSRTNQLIKKIKTSKWYDYNSYFIRGSKHEHKDVLSITIDKNRERIPRDMPVSVHDELNDELEHKHNYKVRNGLYMYPQNGYGEKHYGIFRVIVPMDDAVIFTNDSVYDLFSDTDGIITDDGLEDYANNTYILTPQHFKSKSKYINECMGFGNYLSISIEFAREHDLFDFSHLGSQDIGSYTTIGELNAYSNRHDVIIGLDFIKSLSKVELNNENDYKLFSTTINNNNLNSNPLIIERILNDGNLFSYIFKRMSALHSSMYTYYTIFIRTLLETDKTKFIKLLISLDNSSDVVNTLIFITKNDTEVNAILTELV